MIKKIELDKLFVELITPNIIVVSVKNDSIIDEHDILELKKINLELTEGNDYIGISNSGNYTSITKEARELLASSKMEEKRVGTAFVINNLSHRIMANFYINFNKPSVPVKISTTLEDAISWANKMLNQ